MRGIVAFVRTVSAGSFSAAARQLGVTTVAVSRNVQRLERQLGIRLLQRTTRSLSMTEEGRRFFEATRNALVALGNTGGPADLPLAEPFLASDDELLREQAEWAVARIEERHAG